METAKRARRVELALAALWATAAAACAEPVIESTTALGETRDVIGPYTVHSVIVGTAHDDQVEIFYNPLDRAPEHYLPLAMANIDDAGPGPGELYIGEIPGQPAGTTVRYYIAITRGGERVAEDPTGGDLVPFSFRVLP